MMLSSNTSLTLLCLISTIASALNVPVAIGDYLHLNKRFEIQVNLKLEAPAMLGGLTMDLATLNSPVHETLSRSALYKGAGMGSPSTTKVVDADDEIREVIRGAFWNDDPSCQLFNSAKDLKSNFKQSSGTAWTRIFFQSMKGMNFFGAEDIIGRSHFGDLQFLHAMGSKMGEPPATTRQNILEWAQVLYNLAIDKKGTTWKNKLGEHPIAKKWFTDKTAPSGKNTFHELLTCSSKQAGARVDLRALGSLLHMVQDSYAKGHTKRAPLSGSSGNSTSSSNSAKSASPVKTASTKAKRDTAGQAPLPAKASSTMAQGTMAGGKTQSAAVSLAGNVGKYVRLGAIENFHCYKNQKGHAVHDRWGKDSPQMKIDKPDSFDALWGARDAEDMGIKVAQLWKKGASWESGAKALFEEIFKIRNPGATNSDNTV